MSRESDPTPTELEHTKALVQALAETLRRNTHATDGLEVWLTALSLLTREIALLADELHTDLTYTSTIDQLAEMLRGDPPKPGEKSIFHGDWEHRPLN